MSLTYAAPAPPVARPPADRLPWRALSVLALLGFLLVSTETMPAGLLPLISAGMGTSEGIAGQ
ncbi:hypothetical protein [Cellulomonas sp. NS3]|uniref:hypothetical protein n=1 Tax=Cellulomonas sp. NS3 TaxID=2973977 RepID=UPI002163E7B6|nr:hypothetical protein [Cellulomonas sp. NS3]